MQNLWAGWTRFFFSETDARRYAALRVVFGLFSFYMLASNAPEASNLLSTSGLAKMQWSEFQAHWSMFYFFSSPLAAMAFLLFGILASLCMIAGFQSRIATWITFVAVCSVFGKNQVPYGAYGILQNMLFYIGLSPCGNVWSMDANKSGPRRAEIWPLRLMQLQLALIYFCNGYSKIHGMDWIDGTAVARVLLVFNPGLMEFLRPQSIALTRYLLMAATYATTAWELGFPLLILNRRTLVPALTFGVMLHFGIMMLMGLWVFGAIMIATYLVLIPPDVFRQAVNFIEAQLSARYWKLRDAAGKFTPDSAMQNRSGSAAQ